MKKLISIFVVLLAVMGTMTTFTSCDEETTKEFLMDFYLVQAERYDAAMVKTSEGGSYEKWQRCQGEEHEHQVQRQQFHLRTHGLVCSREEPLHI